MTNLESLAIANGLTVVEAEHDGDDTLRVVLQLAAMPNGKGNTETINWGPGISERLFIDRMSDVYRTLTTYTGSGNK